ncbi:MAG: 50S ribosomal protein L4, partial [Flavobacteriales bacterium]|nr:50S ribosomal protein L4 [Flavobacteriales bacterium]
MELEVYNIEGNKTSKKVKLEESIFGIEPNDHAIYLDVKQILANGRQGTHKSKERSEITGSTKKIRKQKGTGGARRGSIKDPLLRGGGTIFGPRPRNYGFKLNKKMKKVARRSALSYKAKGDGIIIIDQLSMDTPKTKEFQNILGNLKADRKALVVVEEKNDNVYLSARNIPGAKVAVASDLNTYDIMNSDKMIFT